MKHLQRVTNKNNDFNAPGNNNNELIYLQVHGKN